MRFFRVLILIIPLTGLFISCRKDLLPPDVIVRSPSSDTIVHEGHSFQLIVDVNDNEGVSIVRFFIGNREAGALTAPPFVSDINTMGYIGNHELIVLAMDMEGNTGKSDPVYVEVVPNLLPRPSLIVEPRISWIDQPVSFIVDSTTDADDKFDELVFRFDWEDDGIWDTQWASMDSTTHAYEEMGHYIAKMEVKDPQGNISGTSKPLVIWGKFTDPRDGITYPVINLGSDLWFARNLGYQPVKGFVSYGEPGAYPDYGLLYSMDSAYWVCPEGWHLSSMDEWYDLQVFAGLDYQNRDSFEIMSESDVGIFLKSENGWNNNGDGIDAYGFMAKPAGYASQGRYDGIGLITAFWTSRKNDYGFTETRAFDWQHTGILPGSGGQNRALSVRCVMGTGLPVTNVLEVKDNTYPSIEIESEIMNPNGGIISGTGLCWSYQGTPDLNDNIINSDILRGKYSLDIKGLYPADTLYVRAYASNNSGTGFSETEMVILHDSSGILLDERDMQEYKTIKIGNQWWMAENLNYAPDSGSFCYEGRQQNCDKYGRLYPWDTAMLVCPEGWHLPSDEEWMELEFHLGMPVKELNNQLESTRATGSVGTKLKSKTAWPYQWSQGTDEVGFNALPAGIAYQNYTLKDHGTHYWTSSSYNKKSSLFRYIYHSSGVGRHWQPNYNLYSVRCLKD